VVEVGEFVEPGIDPEFDGPGVSGPELLLEEPELGEPDVKEPAPRTPLKLGSVDRVGVGEPPDKPPVKGGNGPPGTYPDGKI
jgi:hypothetical protein